MKRMRFVLATVVFSFLVPTFLCAQDSMIRDTAKLDRAYVPALFLTGQGKVEPSQLSMKYLKKSWSAYKKVYADARPADAQWKKDIDNVEKLIMKADKIVTDGKDLPEAHEALEGVRLILMKARQRNRIEYFPDYLTVFHADMETIFDAANKKKPETLADKNIETIKNMLPQAMSTWSMVKKAKFDAGLYGFSKEALQKMNVLYKAEETALKALDDALRKGDRRGIIEHATSLKGKFVPVYLLFGDFERLKK